MKRRGFGRRSRLACPASGTKTLARSLDVVKGFVDAARKSKDGGTTLEFISGGPVANLVLYFSVMTSAPTWQWQFLVCEGPTCGGCKFSDAVTKTLRQEVARLELSQRISVLEYLCLGRCRDGVNMIVRRIPPGQSIAQLPEMEALEKDDVWLYSEVEPDSVLGVLGVLESHAFAGQALAPFAQSY